MQIQPQYQALVIGSKYGTGVQGTDYADRVASIFDRVLVLEGDRELLKPGQPLADLGQRAIVRILQPQSMLSGGWDAILAHTNHCFDIISECYGYGVRDFQTLNEPNIADEGGGDSQQNYEDLNTIGWNHISWLRAKLNDGGMTDVRLWGPALSPGHNEDDNFVGYTLLQQYLEQLDVILVHLYGKDEGKNNCHLIDTPNADWFACRLNRVRPIIRGMGLQQPFAIGEFNHPGVVLGDQASIDHYLQQVEDYYRWVNEQDDVIVACHFLATNTDARYQDFTFERMTGAFDELARFRDHRFDELTGGPVTPDTGWDPAFQAYAAKHPTYQPANLAGTDQFGIMTQDYSYVTRTGKTRYGVVRVNTGDTTVNGYDPHVVYRALF